MHSYLSVKYIVLLDHDKDLLLGGGYMLAGLSVDYRELMDEMDAMGRELLILENKTK